MSDSPAEPVRRDHLTRFSSGNQPVNRGRKTRDLKEKISSHFLKDMADMWAIHGKAALEATAIFDPPAFCRIYAQVIPKDFEVHMEMGDPDRLQAQLDLLEQIIDERRARDITPTVQVIGNADD